MILVPDHIQGDLYNNDIAPHMTAGKTLMFAHGFNIHFERIKPPAGRRRLHDRAQGSRPSRPRTVHRRRGRARAGRRPSGCVRQGAANALWPMRWRSAACKAGVIETNFSEETESDLFGEQAVLCGGASELIRAGFETLVEAGYAPEIAYFECLHELKLIVDLI